VSEAHSKRGGSGGRSAPGQVELSAAEARRLALSSLGFGVRKPARAGVSHVRATVKRLGAIQIDSVNVLARAHYMPVFSRYGPYPMTALDSLAYEKRELFEFWGHAACYMPVELYPYFRFRMDAHRKADYFKNADPAVKRFIERVYREVRDRGPLAASEVTGSGKAKGNWWGWSDGKRAIEALWRTGRVAIAGRRRFQRLYDIPERVIPKAVLDAPAPSADDARKHLLVTAAIAHGIGAASDIAGYFHLGNWWDRQPVNGKRGRSEAPRLVRELVEEGRLLPASVEGWDEPAYVAPNAKVPSKVDARALVSPFDPLIWNRTPTKRLFRFDYQIEIYVPQPKRIYGYYCLPFALGDELVARVDLKADRKTQTLVVPGAFAEPGRDTKKIAAALGAELKTMASWLELDRIEVGGRGDLARPLVRALR
jgi:uncharacterized protein YcaQ